jgi:beta-N-acetylhexosaminidase
VIELSPAMNAQIGADTGWGIAAALAATMPATTSRRLHRQPADFDATAAEAAGRRLVIAVRDAHRHEWIAACLSRLLAIRPDSVVVEMGLPHGDPPACGGYLATYGASRVSGVAAAEALMGLDG